MDVIATKVFIKSAKAIAKNTAVSMLIITNSLRNYQLTLKWV